MQIILQHFLNILATFSQYFRNDFSQTFANIFTNNFATIVHIFANDFATFANIFANNFTTFCNHPYNPFLRTILAVLTNKQNTPNLLLTIMSTNNNVYHLGPCEICNEKEANAFFDCLIVSYCEDCIATVDNCPICDKPEDITILTFSDYGRKLNVRTIKNPKAE